MGYTFEERLNALRSRKEEQTKEKIRRNGYMDEDDYVRCGEFGWSDVGTWGSVYQHSRKDRYANAVPEEGCYLYDTRSSIVSLPKDKIAVISGLKEYIVVDTDDVLMVCPRSEEQNIKKFIDEVKFHNGDKHI